MTHSDSKVSARLAFYKEDWIHQLLTGHVYGHADLILFDGSVLTASVNPRMNGHLRKNIGTPDYSFPITLHQSQIDYALDVYKEPMSFWTINEKNCITFCSQVLYSNSQTVTTMKNLLYLHGMESPKIPKWIRLTAPVRGLLRVLIYTRKLFTN